MKKLNVVLGALTFGALGAFAQEGVGNVDEGYNEQSHHPIHRSDIMWQKTVLRMLDLREMQNEPLFSRNKEITKIIIEAAKAGEVKIWKTDSLDHGSPLTLEEFLKNMQIPSEQVELSEEEKAFMQEEAPAEEDMGFDDWGDDGGGGGGEADAELAELEGGGDEASGPEYYEPKMLYQLEMKEDMIFDKQRSRMYYDVIAMTLKVPADHPLNIKGIEIPVASFSYKELVDGPFKNNPNAIWYNRYNDAEHRTMHDAIELRLFSSYILKVSNPADDYLVDIYGGDQWTGIMASQWKQYELLEFEHNLWEF